VIKIPAKKEITQHWYFEKKGIISQHRNLKSQSDLDSYEQERRDLFTDKLALPPSAFTNSQLLEFGPSAGENAIVFAMWGASCTLVEPNLKAHPCIKKYFEQFKLAQKLVEVDGSTLESYSKRQIPDKKFDFIVAEGFIYLVKPDPMWIGFFSRIIKNNGFVILNYCETFGNFQELFLKAIHSRMCKLTGMGSVEAAGKWFGAKWNSIPHTTTMESWVADVLDNPTVRLARFYELKELCTNLCNSGFYLYSSWPPYKNSLEVYWAKKMPKPKEQLESQNEFIERSRLSHMFGRKHFLLKTGPEMEPSIKELLTLTDSLIDEFDRDKAEKCIEHLGSIERLIGSDAVISEPKDVKETLNAIKSIKHILNLLIAGNADDIAAFCSSDKAFIKSWGMPTHYAVFRKGSE